MIEIKLQEATTTESPLLLSTMFTQEVHLCKYNEEDSPGVFFAGRLYITLGLTPKQWARINTAVSQKRDTERCAQERRMNNGRQARQQQRQYKELKDCRLRMTQGEEHETQKEEHDQERVDTSSANVLSGQKEG